MRDHPRSTSRSAARLLRATMWLGLALASTACDLASRRIAGDYRLRRRAEPASARPATARSATARPASSTFELWNTARPENEAGWSGLVVRLGWDARYVGVLRGDPPTPYGARAGWTVIDLTDRTELSGLTEAEFRRRPEVAHLTTYSVDSAWARLATR